MFKKIAAAAALACVASSAFAAPTAFYGGLDAGATRIDGLGDRKTSFGGFAGYGFDRNVAVELSYRQLGKWDDVKLNQTQLSVLGSFPLNRQLDIYGRLGYNQLRLDTSFTGYRYDIGNGALYGIGLNYSFAPNISGRVEVQKPSRDSTNIGVGIVFKF